MTEDFGETYRSLTDEAILKLWAERSQLVREAKVSVSEEIRRRSLSVEADVIAKNTAHEATRTSEAKKLPEYHKVVRLVGNCILGTCVAVLPALLVTKAAAEHNALVVFFVSLIPLAVLFTVLVERYWGWQAKSSVEAFETHLRKRYENGLPPVGK